jgi:arylsulfatase A-like enzyme
VRRILDCLDRTGLAEDTLVLFTTDHGHFLGQHGLIAKGPFHFEDMIRIPMLVRWPGQAPEGVVSEALQSQVDFVPSFLSAAGLEVPGILQGVDQTPVWRGEAESAREWIICENRHQPTRVHLRTFVNRRYKLTLYRGQTYGELFDLVSDPGEVRNLWDSREHQPLKQQLLFEFLQAELEREPTRMPRTAGA